MKFYDTHAHLDDDAILPELDDVIRRAEDAGLVGIVAIGTTAASSQRCLEIAQRHGIVRAAVGVQPNYVADATERDWESIVALAREPDVCAIGETGLDHYWDYAPLERQREFFDRHLQLAHSTRLPVVIHMRESPPNRAARASISCCQDILHRLEQQRSGPWAGVMHSYTGDSEFAARFIDLGLHISFAGMVTYKNASELRQVACRVPASRLLIETDSPYLSPVPKRGQRPNEPALVVHTAACLAEARNEPLATLAASTTANAIRLFHAQPQPRP